MKKISTLSLVLISLLAHAQKPVQLTWDLLSETKWSDVYIPEIDQYYWKPAFSNEVKALEGTLVVTSGYITDWSSDGKPRFVLTKTEGYFWGCYAPPPEQLVTVDFRKVDPKKIKSRSKVEVLGILRLNADNIYETAFILDSAHFITDGSVSNKSIHYDEGNSLPYWAQLLYSENPNVWEVKAAYENYFQEHEFEKTIHTQNYKRWVSKNQNHVNAHGEIVFKTAVEKTEYENEMNQLRGDDTWSYAGPEIHYNADGLEVPMSQHANVYCNDRSMTDPNLLYCGTESGGLYKTTDQGMNWEFVTKNMLIGSVSAVRIHPTNSDIVIFCGANDLYRTTNGGDSWDIIGQPAFVAQNISAWEIAFNPEDPTIVYAAAEQGFFRSTDGGDNWEEIWFNDACVVQFKPGDASVVYSIFHFPDTDEYKFFKSIDYGATFTMYDNGWFAEQPGFEDMDIFGGRIAVSEADPNRIYAIVVGYGEYEQGVETNGWIGAYVSYDAGETWTFPHDQIGTPYTAEHQNLMNFVGDDGTYSQILYNTTIVASQLDADKVLIGGLNLWRSDDACATYQGVGGYIGGIPYFHVDQQELKIYKTGIDTEEVWCSNDGGICYSTDFMQSIENRCRGIMAVNLWGYDQGWNEDIMVGGRYHNGNMGYHENYPEGEFLSLGGGEAPTGYVNYSDQNKTYFSDIGGRILPDAMTGLPEYFSMSLAPNESYWFNNSSRILFDHHYFNVAWLGKENKIYRSLNGGSTFSEFHAFGSNVNDQVFWFEQSYANPDYMYVHQRVNNVSKIWRTTDGGDSWNEIDLPYTLSNLVFDLSATNPDELWVGFTYGGNGNKIFHTEDAGDVWDNISTSALDGMEIWGLAHQYGTDGGVYLAMLNGNVFYRNNAMSDWQQYSSGLPVSTQPIRIVPFYKENKIRLATWNLGVWEAPLFEQSVLIADFAAEYGTYFCPGDPVHFVDHSVCSDEAIYDWSFPGATPSTSEEKYPTVVYTESGTYDVTLTVTDNGMNESVTKTAYISSALPGVFPLTEGFESGAIPETWKFAHSTGGGTNWVAGNLAGGYDESEYSMYFDNYWNDTQGNRDEIWLEKLEIEMLVDIGYQLSFDVAYAEYGWPYSDTLGVLLSTDCGTSWEEIYVKGGEELSTSPPNGNPFVPLAEEWRTDIVDFSEYLDYELEFEELIIAFQNRGRWGNILYVDNINIDYVTGVNEELNNAHISLFPNPTSGAFQLSVDGLQPGEIMMQIYDAQGKIIHEEKIISAGNRLEKMISLDRVATGVYTLKISGDGFAIVEKVDVR